MAYRHEHSNVASLAEKQGYDYTDARLDQQCQHTWQICVSELASCNFVMSSVTLLAAMPILLLVQSAMSVWP